MQLYQITLKSIRGGPSFSSLHETLGKYEPQCYSETESFDDNDYVINCHILRYTVPPVCIGHVQQGLK